MTEQASVDELVERLLALRVVLKSGEYDGADLMHTWCAMMDAADLIQQQASEIVRLREAMQSALAHRYGEWPAILDAALNPLGDKSALDGKPDRG